MVAPPEARAGRRDINRLLTDGCTITRADGDPTFNSTTGKYAQATTVVYQGACRIRPSAGAADRVEQVGGQAVSTRLYKLTVPHDTPDLELEDLVIVDTSDDPTLVGAGFRVVDPAKATFRIARTVVVEEVRG